MKLKSYPFKGLLHRNVRFLQSVSNLSDERKPLKTLCAYLNISESKAHYMCMKHPIITKLDDARLKSLMETIKEIGFTNDALIDVPGFFGVLPITLKFRHRVLQESGIHNVTPEVLSSYFKILRQRTVGDLKSNGEIPNHINVENRLASYMTQWPTSLTSVICDDIDNTTLYALRLKIIQRYLELVLDLTCEEFFRGIETYPTLKHRPLEVINETLTLLLSQIMIPAHKIKSNFYLVHADPENLKNIIYKFRYIGGIDIKEVLRLHPKLATRSYVAMLETRKILEEFGISKEAQRRCFDIYTLAPETVKERLIQAKTIPEFSVLINHPRFLKVIHYNKTAMKRLDKLYNKNKKCVSINILSGSTAHYEVFEKAPGDRLGKGRDLVFCVSQLLEKKYRKNHIHHILRRHPFWINIPIVQVQYVYEQLSLKFSNNDIFENCTILLYPWNKIRETLKLFEKNNFKDQLPFLHDCFNYNAISKSQRLSLVLYMLERKHYFSGNGVWSEEKNRIINKTEYQELKVSV